MSQPSRSIETVARLKELLFERESRELGTLSDRIEEVQKRAGSDEVFQQSVAKVLKGAFDEVEQSGPRLKDVSEAMAPMVLRTLDRELKSQSRQDQIAGMIYPRLGGIVRSYVASAIRDMMETINQRLEAGLTQNRFMLWMRSRASGRTMAEQALFDSQRLEVVELYLVRRGSGELIHHWERQQPSEAPPPGARDNRDTLVSGFLAAITAFAEEAFDADKASLRTVDLGEHRLFIRGSPDYLLAAKCRGSAPKAIEQLLDNMLLRVLEQQQVIEREAANAPREAGVPAGSPDHEPFLAEVASGIDSEISKRVREASRRRGSRRLKLLACLIGLPIIAFAGWSFYLSTVTRDLQARVDTALAEIEALKGYPVKAHVERGGSRIWVTGLAPDESTLHVTIGRLKIVAPSAELRDAISVLPKADVEARLGAEAFKRAIAGARRKLDALALDLASARDRAPEGAERALLSDALDTTQGVIAEIAADAPVTVGQGAEQAVDRAVPALRQMAERLGATIGLDVSWPGPITGNSIEGAEALTLAADRVSMLLPALDHRRSIAPVVKEMEAVRERMAERLAELELRLEEMRPKPPSPRELLAAFVRDHAIFFSNDADFRDAAAAARTLDALAPLVTGAGTSLRVVGYTDEIGTTARNSPLAQARADKVLAELVARGVPRALLVAVGRANGVNIAQGTGADSSNRRVELEIAFEGESGGRP